MKTIKNCIVAVVCVFVLTSQVFGAVYWSNSSGSTAYYDWENGQSANGLFGDPILTGNTLTFGPQGFRAESVNGALDTVSDTLVFDIIAHSGNTITGITINEQGDYGILGTGSVNVFGTITVQNLSGPGAFNTNLTTNPTMPVTSGAGNWLAFGDIGLDDWTHIRITLCNNLTATTSDGGSAFIEKKIVGCPVSITIIPEPATLVLLAGGIICLRKKRLCKET